jgi:hypothetical protein
MMITPVASAAVGIALAFSPAAHFFGFTALPLSFFLILFGMIGTYLVLIEFAKSRFYRAENRPHRPRPTREERHVRHVTRRAARFVRHHPAGEASN